jgi:hypothetical protein
VKSVDFNNVSSATSTPINNKSINCSSLFDSSIKITTIPNGNLLKKRNLNEREEITNMKKSPG